MCSFVAIDTGLTGLDQEDCVGVYGDRAWGGCQSIDTCKAAKAVMHMVALAADRLPFLSCNSNWQTCHRSAHMEGRAKAEFSSNMSCTMLFGHVIVCTKLNFFRYTSIRSELLHLWSCSDALALPTCGKCVPDTHVPDPAVHHGPCICLACAERTGR